MAAPSRKPDTSVALSEIEEHLRDHSGAFDFFQAVRLLLRIREERNGAVGPDREAIRFSTKNSLAFPACTVDSIDFNQQIPHMLVTFMGLTGPGGVLPHSYTELILERQRSKDTAIAEFFDIFNHRMISLFYRAWEKYRFPVAYERAVLRNEGLDRVSSFLLAFLGLGTIGLQDEQNVADLSLLFYTGLLSQQPRSAAALRHLLEDYFGVPTEVEQFVGSWHRLSSRDQCVFADRDSLSEQLGAGSIVGDEVWDQQARARIRMGPLKRQRYLDFLPTGTAYQPLQAIVQFFSNGQVQFELQLVLQREQVPDCELGREGEAGVRLGWFTWMKSLPVFDRHADDTILLLN
jgi:type VI secretion system protein ImpH